MSLFDAKNSAIVSSEIIISKILVCKLLEKEIFMTTNFEDRKKLVEKFIEITRPISEAFETIEKMEEDSFVDEVIERRRVML